jgi:mRNA-degrading endonuclease RelE of RelBE toxin-antitoxin system
MILIREFQYVTESRDRSDDPIKIIIDIYHIKDILYSMWAVYETKAVTKEVHKLPKQVQRKYKVWVEVARNGGSANLRNFPGFKDEKLQGELRECRSSRLNIQYRVIYSEKKDVKEIIVLKVTPHEY